MLNFIRFQIINPIIYYFMKRYYIKKCKLDCTKCKLRYCNKSLYNQRSDINSV